MDAERLRRMADCWRSNEPSGFEESTAFRRWEERQRRPVFLRPWVYGALGMAAGFVVMWAVGRGPEGTAPITREPVARPAEPAARPPSPRFETIQDLDEPIPPPPPPRLAPRVTPTPKPQAVRSDAEDLTTAERWLAVSRGEKVEPILSALEKQKQALDEKSAGTK